MSFKALNKNRYLKILIAVIFFLPAAGTLFCQTTVFEGSLGPGDARLGKYFDTHSVQIRSGMRVMAVLTSSDFDTYLFVESPGGVERRNDDYGEDGTDSRLEFVSAENGEWKFKVTSCEDNTEGNYKLTITKEYLGEATAYSGVLDKDDPIAMKGEYYDSYSFRARANQRIVITMESDDFDSYLVVQPPSGYPRINDDYQDESQSLIDFITETGGEYRIYTTSSFPAEKGAYELSILLGRIVDGRIIPGRLDEKDAVLDGYGYYDEYTFFWEAGRHVIAELSSGDFDTYLFLEKPDGSEEENDDYNELVNLSRIELVIEQAGEYLITVSSYEEGENGSYTLKVFTWDNVGGN
jgi:hypothetical protein